MVHGRRREPHRSARALTARIQRAVTGAPLPFPSVADIIYLLEYPLFVAGLVLFIRARSAERDLRSVLDALMLTVGLGLLAVLFLLVPDATNPALSWPQRFVSVAYPVGDLLIVMTLARLLAPGADARPASAALITLGTVGGSHRVRYVAYDLIKNSGNPHGGHAAHLGWLALLHRLGRRRAASVDDGLTQPAGCGELSADGADEQRRRSCVVASLIPPVVLFVHAWHVPRWRRGLSSRSPAACSTC